MTQAQEKVLASIKQLPDQCLQAWEETQKLEFDGRYREIWNVAACGMGASGLPNHVINNLFKRVVPVLSVGGYKIPSWSGEHTLIYLSSYSGNTEEILLCAEQAKSSGCIVTGATTGGQLGEWFKENSYTAYIYNPTHNPSEQPRMGLGYGIFGQLGILTKLEVVEDVDSAPSAIDNMRTNMDEVEKTAQEGAQKLKDSALVIFGAEHLVGNAHIFANQINETAKTFATWFSIPKANHYLLEGLKHPKFPLAAIFLESENYSPSIKKRMELTKQIVEKNGHSVQSYSLKRPGLSRLAEVLETLSFSSYVSYYLAEVYNEDPIAIPWVDYFKKELRNA